MMEDQRRDTLLIQTLEKVRKLEETLKQIQQRVEKLEIKQPPKIKVGNELNPQSLLEIDLMNLPDNLRRTMMALAQLGEATPEAVAEITKRTRGLENIYLKQLEMLNYIEKLKKGKRVYYRSLRII